MNEQRLVIGKLLKPRGLKGELKVFPLTDFPERFLDLKSCYLEDEQGKLLKTLRVARAEVHSGSIILVFEAYQDRNLAQQLSGFWISVDREEAVDLPPDTYFICDLIGCEVYDEVRGFLGKVSRVDATGAHDVVTVQDAGQKDLLYPNIKQVVRRIDLDAKRIEVVLPEGLYELYRSCEFPF